MVVVPTDTIYGIAALPGGAHPDSTGADVVRRIYDAREREPEPALPFLLASRPDMGRLTRPNIAAIRLARRFWPGSLTLILPPSPDLPAALRAFPIAVRVPNFPALIPLLTAIGGYLLTTGAIRSGYSPAITASEANQLFGNDVALILDGGRTPYGIPSTIIDCVSDPPEILRRGSIPDEQIWQVLQYTSPDRPLPEEP